MLAVISDIHSNIEAHPVGACGHRHRQIQQVVCLGNVVGYGPWPKECLDLIAKHAAVTMMGNHDYAVLYEPIKFNVGAEAACFWTRSRLEDEPDDAARNARWDAMGKFRHQARSERQAAGPDRACLRPRQPPPADQRVHLPR